MSHIQKLQLAPICKCTMLQPTPPFSLDWCSLVGILPKSLPKEHDLYTHRKESFQMTSILKNLPTTVHSHYSGGQGVDRWTGERNGTSNRSHERRPVTPAPSCLVLVPHWPPATAWVPMKAPHVRAAGHSIDLQSCHKGQYTLIHETHPFQTQPSPIRRGATAGRPVVAKPQSYSKNITIHHAGGIFLYKRNPR